MSGTINYDFSPNDNVYIIDECDDKPYVTSGVVVRVRAEVLVVGEKILYDVRLINNSGTKEFQATDVFADKATAIAEYETRVA